MAEHTCTVRASMLPTPCPGCQEHFEALFTKERELLDAVLILARRYPLPFLNEWDESVYRLAREYLQLKGELLGHAPRLHLYEFDQGGYYAALSKESAFELYNADVGDDLAAEDFDREVPDYEEIEVTIEVGDKWNDPREYSKPIKPQQGLNGTIDVVWCLKLTAREWANEQGHSSPGHCFGGDC